MCFMYCLQWRFEDYTGGEVVGTTTSLFTVYFTMKQMSNKPVFRLMQLGNNCLAELEEDGRSIPWFKK